MTDITLTTTVSIPKEKFIGSPIGEELMLMDLDSGDYISLNELGAFIWKFLEQSPHEVTEICIELMKVYDVDEATCKAQTVDYLQKLHDKGFINAT